MKNNPTSTVKPSVVTSISFHELLECLVCTNSMYPPIHQCLNGHTLCSGCKSKVNNRCPTCRYELGNIRGLALEKVAASLELPCKYQSHGCQEIFPYYIKLNHEAQYTFRPYNHHLKIQFSPVAGESKMQRVHLEKQAPLVSIMTVILLFEKINLYITLISNKFTSCATSES